jgi:tetratricopeptide (TPR) repeat protein
MEEAVRHFDRVLELWGEKRPKSRSMSILYLLFNLLRVLRSLYLPTRKVKRVPSKRLNDMFEAIYHRGTALVSFDTRRMVTDSIRFLSTIRKYDLDKVSNGIQMYASSSALFFFPGISFRIARKLLEYASSYIRPDDRKTLFQYKFWELAMNTLAGKWQEDIPYEESVIDQNIKDGDMFTPPGYVYFAGTMVAEQGKFDLAELYLNKLAEIGEVYENDYVRSLRYSVGALLLLKRRSLTEAIREADARIDWLRQIGQTFRAFFIIGVKIQSCLLLGDLAEAENALKHGETIAAREKYIAPYYVEKFLIGKFLHDLCRLEQAIQTKDRTRIGPLIRKASKSGKAAIKNARKCALGRTEALRMMGEYLWLTGRQKKAFSWWEKSIRAGQALGAQPELARTYFEVGRRLLGKDDGKQKFLGQSADVYLGMARRMFEEMGIPWDMER